MRTDKQIAQELLEKWHNEYRRKSLFLEKLLWPAAVMLITGFSLVAGVIIQQGTIIVSGPLFLCFVLIAGLSFIVPLEGKDYLPDYDYSRNFLEFCRFKCRHWIDEGFENVEKFLKGDVLRNSISTYLKKYRECDPCGVAFRPPIADYRRQSRALVIFLAIFFSCLLTFFVGIKLTNKEGKEDLIAVYSLETNQFIRVIETPRMFYLFNRLTEKEYALFRTGQRHQVELVNNETGFVRIVFGFTYLPFEAEKLASRFRPRKIKGRIIPPSEQLARYVRRAIRQFFERKQEQDKFYPDTISWLTIPCHAGFILNNELMPEGLRITRLGIELIR